MDPMKHLLSLLALATFTAPAHAQAERCARFQNPADQARCRSELLGSIQSPSGPPYCLPMTTQQHRAAMTGQRVVVRGIDGCWQEWN